MKATLGDLPSSDVGWHYEVKWDGMRAIALVNEPDRAPLRLYTTGGHDAAERLPEAMSPHRLVLDGELVAFDGGRPSFGRMQQRMNLARPGEIARMTAVVPVVYVVFDLLHVDGRDTTALPYVQRRRLLAEIVTDGPAWRVPAHHVDGGADLLQVARDLQLEGIVAKRADSPYVPGRSKLWRKIKVRARQEFVVGGWKGGDGNRSGQLGSLLLGYHDPNGALRYAGRVGTGFTQAELRRLVKLLIELAADQPAFDPPPPREVARAAHWVRPELVVEVAYGEWTTDGVLRHPAYLGLRSDKDPIDVVRES